MSLRGGHIIYQDLAEPFVADPAESITVDKWQVQRFNPPLRKATLSAAILAGSFFMVHTTTFTGPESITVDKWFKEIGEPYFAKPKIISYGMTPTYRRVGTGLPTTDLFAYYEADTGVTQSSNRVSQWNDLSGNGRHLVQTDGPHQPLWNGVNEILFDADIIFRGEYLVYDNTSPITHPLVVYGVAKYSSGLGSPELFIYSDNVFSYGTAIAGSLAKAETNGGTFIATVDSTVQNTYYLIKSIYNGVNSVIQINNLAESVGDASGTGSSDRFLEIRPGTISGSDTVTIKALYFWRGSIPSDAQVKNYILNKFPGLY